MALVVADRVQETTTTSGTGTLTLAGAVAGYQTFSSAIGNGNTTFYTIYDNVAQAWEVGVGTVGSGTLARTTVLSSSAGGTTKITLAGNTASVFCTYPAEKSVNLNADGVMEIGESIGYADTDILATFASTVDSYNQIIVQNKSNGASASSNINISNNVATDTTGFAELGINSSGFVGTGSFSIPEAAYLASAGTDLTIGTYNANDIHFVTNSNTTDAMTIFDDGGISLGELANPGIGNIACNNINLKFQQVVTSGGTTTLTNASPYFTQFTGTNTQTLVLPDATTCLVGTNFIFDNDSTQDVTIKDGAGTTFELLVPGGYHNFVLEQNSTVAGTWLRYSSVPSTVEWGTNSLALATTVISGGTWQGGTIQSGYGGTGLTTFGAANYALYSTSASTLTAGTLPVAAGGTGSTTLTANNVLLGNGTSALQTVAPGTLGNVLTSDGTTWTSAAPVTGVTVTNDTSTATALYPTFTSATSGSISGVSVTSTKLNFTPSTGTLAAPQVSASNGIVVNSKTIATTYAIPSGSNAMSAGPVTVSSGVTVTVPTGSRWVVL